MTQARFRGPARARVDQAQPRQPEVRHRARRRADIVGKLRLDQDQRRVPARSTQVLVLSVPAPGIFAFPRCVAV
jgi:hypothetical protein